MLPDNLITVILVLTGVFIFILASIITKYIRIYSINNALLDVPNARSSHDEPTPRGGGLSIVIISLSVITVLFLTGFLKLDYYMSLGIGGLLIATIGWLDDHVDVPAVWRGILYIVISIWAVFWIFDFNTLLNLSDWLKFLFYVLLLSWIINLYNFMDGSDGLASSQAILASFLSGFVLLHSNQLVLAIIVLTLGISSSGFLVWNWPKAKIFLGDVGSCYMGYIFGVLAIIHHTFYSHALLFWFTLLALFISDASLTLIIRAFSGKKWYKAHREHAYQKYLQMGNTHKKLLVYFILINMLFIWPVALLIYLKSNYAIYTFCILLICMFLLWSLIQVTFNKKQKCNV